MKQDANVRVGVIGLGYVGLTLGVALAQQGIKVIGVERRPEVVELTRKGIPHFSETGLAEALSAVVNDDLFEATETLDGQAPCDYYVITVGTPLDGATHLPRLDMIEAASRQVADHLTAGATVILRSTVQLGTTRNIVKPVIDTADKPYFLAMCPERTLEGDALRELANLPQIVGGVDAASSEKAAGLFGRLTRTTVLVDNPETAEMLKLVDNTYRDVRFAFGNEVARACVAAGINAHDVIKLGKLEYQRTNVALPGLVGGPCLEKDPHILMHSLQSFGIDLEITRASRLVNERQPAETVAAIMNIAKQRGLGERLRIAVFGLAFKGVPATDDLRGSMALKVIDALKATGDCAELRLFDPVIDPSTLEATVSGSQAFATAAEAAKGADIVVITNNHPSFGVISIDQYSDLLTQSGFVYDYWNNNDHEPYRKKENFYFTVGNLFRRPDKWRL
jgi:UDP-N-acetyl-D-mannosaminuronic acid dehydrogenase